MSDTSRIHVLSLNCWGLKFVAKNLDERIEAIAHYLANATHDIIGLQEIWVFAHFERIQQRVSNRLPHSKFFYSGALGAGLAIFSRYPIVSAGIHPYSLNGAPLDVIAGDWFVGKAAAHVIILHPILGQIQVFNTHFFARGEYGPEHTWAHRLVNAWEFAKLARHAAEVGKYVIAMGDFNSTPPALPMTVILEHANLQDSWALTHPNIDVSQISTPLDAVHLLGITVNSPLNTYKARKARAQGTLGKRLDYVLYRQPNRPGKLLPQLKAVESKVTLTDPVPGQNFSYSDHFGLEVTLEIVPSDMAQVPSAMNELSNETSATVISALNACYQFSRERSKKELIIFGLCIVILLIVVIGTAWLPHSWLNPIFLLFTIFIAWLATTMLYDGFIFGNWECNALMNVIEELQIHRKSL